MSTLESASSWLDGTLVKVNRQACRATGFTEDELLGMNVSDMDPQMTSTLFDELVRKRSTAHAVTIKSTHRRKDGSTFPVDRREKS